MLTAGNHGVGGAKGGASLQFCRSICMAAPHATKRDKEYMDESNTESATKKQRKFAIADGLCQDILPPIEGKPIATFYLVDANYPLRKQLYEENLISLEEHYAFSDLCVDLQPANKPKGEYRLIRIRPRVYMYIFTTTVRASHAKLDDFAIQISEVANKLILPELTSNTVIEVEVLDLRQFRIFHAECVLGLMTFCDKVLKNEEITPELRKEAAMYVPTLETFGAGETSQSEVAVNSTLVNVLRQSIFKQAEFHVQSYSTERHVTKYASSRQDIIIFHKKKYVKEGIVTGAIVSGASSAPEIENEDTPTIEDAEHVQEHEDNLGQLAANMLKLAGNLCQKCIRESEVPLLVKEIMIYGALIEVRSSSAKPACLHICFNETSALSIGEETMSFAECMYRLEAVLSAE